MFHDGSLGNLDDGKRQSGRIACLTNKSGHSVASWIFWEFRTIKRVCRSSSASEVLSAVEGYDATMCLLALWKEISGQDLDVLLVTDSESLQQKAVTTALPTEKPLRIDMDTLSRFASWRVRPGVGGLVEQPGESTNGGSLWHKPNNVGQASFAARFGDELYASQHGPYCRNIPLLTGVTSTTDESTSFV
jgi:hypothetical protein